MSRRSPTSSDRQRANQPLDPDALEAFAARKDEGPVRMLNLLKFKPGGAAHYQDYASATAPLLRKVGGVVVYTGRPAELLIGDQAWDLLLLVEYPTRGALLAMITSAAYQEHVHLRQAALERSVLYAIDPLDTPLVEVEAQ